MGEKLEGLFIGGGEDQSSRSCCVIAACLLYCRSDPSDAETHYSVIFLHIPHIFTACDSFSMHCRTIQSSFSHAIVCFYEYVETTSRCDVMLKWFGWLGTMITLRVRSSHVIKASLAVLGSAPSLSISALTCLSIAFRPHCYSLPF